MATKKNVLGIDWWKKYIWLAYINRGANDMIMPIGYVINGPSAFFELGDIIARYNIGKIIVWVPNDEDVREHIERFVEQLKMIVEDIPVDLVSEDYTSVQAQEVQWEFRKTEKEDTIAAMKILENYIKNLPKN